MENHLEEPAVAYKKIYTAEEYHEMEWVNGIRYEFWNGELVAMASPSLTHTAIVSNINYIIKIQGKKRGCNTFMSEASLKLSEGKNYFLPDVLMTCDEIDITANRFIQNPTILVEVLSESNQAYDYNQKWKQYQKIRSLRYYLLVSQFEYKIEMYSRPNEFSQFYYQNFEVLDNIIKLDDLGFEIHLQDVYEGIELPQIQEPSE